MGKALIGNGWKKSEIAHICKVINSYDTVGKNDKNYKAKEYALFLSTHHTIRIESLNNKKCCERIEKYPHTLIGVYSFPIVPSYIQEDYDYTMILMVKIRQQKELEKKNDTKKPKKKTKNTK